MYKKRKKLQAIDKIDSAVIDIHTVNWW